jgi:hypothetical protein
MEVTEPIFKIVEVPNPGPRHVTGAADMGVPFARE